MYLIFDTETTGLPRTYHAPMSDVDNWPRVVQVAWQLHDGKGSLLSQKNYIIRPEGFTIPYNAEKVHGISTDFLHFLGHLHICKEKPVKYCSVRIYPLRFLEKALVNGSQI